MNRIIFLLQVEMVDLEFGQSSCETLAFATKKDAEEKFAEVVNNITRIGSPYPEYKEEANEITGEHKKMWFASNEKEYGGYFNKHILVTITPTELYGENEYVYTNANINCNETIKETNESA